MGYEVMDVDEIRQRIVDLANVFLPDGFNSFVDVFERVRARREMRELINDAALQWGRSTPGQLIEMLFYNDGRTRRKITDVYGKKASVPVSVQQGTPSQSTGQSTGRTPQLGPGDTVQGLEL
jgi:hypothetical protein